MSILKTVNLTKTYDSGLIKVNALTDVNFELQREI